MPAPHAPELELDAAGLRAYVLGSMALSGAAHADPYPPAVRALGWYRELVGRGAARGVLFSWVHDLGHLLLEGDTFSFRSLLELSSWPEAERGPRLEYENRLLNGLLRDPSLRRASEFLRQDASRDDLVVRGLELLLGPLVRAGGHEAAPVVEPPLLRELQWPPQLDPRQEAARLDALTGVEGTLLQALRSSLERWFRARPPGPAFDAADLAEIEHWSAYRRAAQRLAGRRIAARAGGFPPLPPRGAVGPEEQEVETDLPDSGTYPSGGYTELGTRGELESLVPTELVYMGEDALGDAADPEVDLFTLRTLESETLYFQRDSGQLRRMRRVVHVAVAPQDGLRIQLRWHPDPLLVQVFGLVVRLCEDLVAVFPADAVSVHLHLIARDEEERARCREDLELLRVLLRHEVARGTAEVSLAGAEFDLRAQGERGRRVYGLGVQSGDRPPAGLPAGPPPPAREGVRPPRLLVWQLGGERLAAPPPGCERISTPLEGAPEAALVQARAELLAHLAGLGSRRGGPPLPSGPPRGVRRREGGRWENLRDGSELVRVPPGSYPLGAREANPERNQLQPERVHTLERGVLLGRHPVTWRQYRRFCQETRRVAPEPAFPVQPDHPVHGVDLDDARAYCVWAGLRLPTEEEWECAARGPEGRRYPWGDAPPAAGGVLRANHRPLGGGLRGTCPVGSFSSYAAACGAEDLAGNVWEWVEPGPRAPAVVRGGSWDSPAEQCRGASRSLNAARGPTVGFRVARDLPRGGE